VKVEVKQLTSWDEALNAARVTINRDPESIAPSNKFIERIILAEHSPIRIVQYSLYWPKIKSWVATHILRHHVGTLPYVGTQRSDRTGVDRSELSQDTEVPFLLIANVQSLINISRKRLCLLASKETREAWQEAMAKLFLIDTLVTKRLARECVYRGFCPEIKCCGFVQSSAYELLRKQHVECGILPKEEDV
jgi:hypothetical protein